MSIQLHTKKLVCKNRIQVNKKWINMKYDSFDLQKVRPAGKDKGPLGTRG